MASPIEQFQIKPIIPAIGFTNSSLFMVGAAALIVGGLLLATRKRAIVPGRSQSIAEMLHEFVAGTLKDATGQEGMKFFPLVFTLFMFVLTANLLGMIPVSSPSRATSSSPSHSPFWSSARWWFTASSSTARIFSGSSCRRACPAGCCRLSC